MTALENIPVRSATAHGNVRPILAEVRHALDRLLDSGEPTTIDLASLPFGPGELDELQSILGRGEVDASLDSLGRSRIVETTYAGVWWIEHRNVNDEIVGRYVEVTRAPEILLSQDADVAAGMARLKELLD